MALPEHGIPPDDLFARMRERKSKDADWEAGRTFSLVYPASAEVDALLKRANDLYVFENALNPFRFPSLRQMESEVVDIACELVHGGEESGGAMTSGGTESILMAAKTARERAREERGVTRPNMVVPYTAHPAFAKACHYLGLEHRQVPIDGDFRARVDAAEARIDDQTCLVVGSAPNYPFGVVDPIPELAALALERGISFHTDACLGGFLLPFLERLGEPVPPFDFRVPGVTTISTDVHKYGYATKGASVIAHRDRSHLRSYQLFLYEKWPGGLYGSFALAGARPAAPIAAAWAVLHGLGWQGYLDLARILVETTARFRAGIDAIDGLAVNGDPVMSVMSFGSATHPIAAIGDAMDDRGWNLDRQQEPDALHLMLSPIHARVVDDFLRDLAEAVESHGPSRGVEARYS
ncbi:MAG: pyridoxal phosphate-dependent decarboxylase family protein [Myxococcota bacterium]